MSLDQFNIYRDTIMTGDCLFFSGKGKTSGWIKRFTNSKYSHVGIAVWYDLDNTGSDLYIIESTTLNNTPDISGEYRRGVQIVKMSQKLDAYDGKAWILRLNKPLSVQEETGLKAWWSSLHSSKIDYDYAQAIASTIDPERWKFPFSLLRFLPAFTTKEDMTRIFCSELVCKSLQRVGRVDGAINPSEETPEDVAGYDCFNKEKIELL